MSIFSCAYWSSVSSLEKCLFKSSAIFQLDCLDLLLLNCRSCVYTLEINPLLVALFANIFSHSMGCLFTLIMVSFAVQELICLTRSHLFILAFICIAWEIDLKKH